MNCVAPGPIWTPLQPVSKPPQEVAEHGADTPVKRPGQPEEVAPAFVFFASEADSSYISLEMHRFLPERHVTPSVVSRTTSRSARREQPELQSLYRDLCVVNREIIHKSWIVWPRSITIHSSPELTEPPASWACVLFCQMPFDSGEVCHAPLLTWPCACQTRRRYP